MVPIWLLHRTLEIEHVPESSTSDATALRLVGTWAATPRCDVASGGDRGQPTELKLYEHVTLTTEKDQLILWMTQSLDFLKPIHRVRALQDYGKLNV